MKSASVGRGGMLRSVNWLGLVGDSQADLRFHGGRNKAVLVYSGDHYPDWRSELGIAEMGPGGFGENLTVAGADERSVCIGDHWRIANVLFEVSQPRQPCWKLGRRWRRPDLPKRTVVSGRTGWYCRVLEEGELDAGLAMTLERRPHPEWTIVAANRVMYTKQADSEVIRALIGLPELSSEWKDELGERVMA